MNPFKTKPCPCEQCIVFPRCKFKSEFLNIILNCKIIDDYLTSGFRYGNHYNRARIQKMNKLYYRHFFIEDSLYGEFVSENKIKVSSRENG